MRLAIEAIPFCSSFRRIDSFISLARLYRPDDEECAHEKDFPPTQTSPIDRGNRAALCLCFQGLCSDPLRPDLRVSAITWPNGATRQSKAIDDVIPSQALSHAIIGCRSNNTVWHSIQDCYRLGRSI